MFDIQMNFKKHKMNYNTKLRQCRIRSINRYYYETHKQSSFGR